MRDIAYPIVHTVCGSQVGGRRTGYGSVAVHTRTTGRLYFIYVGSGEGQCGTRAGGPGSMLVDVGIKKTWGSLCEYMAHECLKT